MVSNTGFALLIGVDDYSTYDPAMSLKGSREDALKLYWMCRNLLGLSPENIRVLTSPPLSAKDFYATEPPPPDMMGPATSESIQAGVAWIAERMASNAAAPGLLTYSGHGSYAKDKGALLCPSDIGRDLAKGIAVRDLSKSEALQKVRDRLTVVLDCCHAAPVTTATSCRAPTALPHDATPEEVAADHADFDISERVLLAARPGQHAHQALLGKVFHGALTFALVTVAEQWKASQGSEGSGMHVSYGQLLKRVRRMLSSLEIKQSVRLRVPEDKRKAIRALPLFGTHAALTTRRPDAPRVNVQLVPNYYTLTLNYHDANNNEASIVFAGVVAAGASDVTVNNHAGTTVATAVANTESWFVNAPALTAVSTARSLDSVRIGSSVIPSNNIVTLGSTFVPTGLPNFTSGESVGWSQSPQSYSQVSYYFQGTATSPYGTAYLQLVFAGGTSRALCGVQWFVSTDPVPGGSSTGDINPTNATAYSSVTTAPASTYWNAASL